MVLNPTLIATGPHQKQKYLYTHEGLRRGTRDIRRLSRANSLLVLQPAINDIRFPE